MWLPLNCVNFVFLRSVFELRQNNEEIECRFQYLFRFTHKITNTFSYFHIDLWSKSYEIWSLTTHSLDFFYIYSLSIMLLHKVGDHGSPHFQWPRWGKGKRMVSYAVWIRNSLSYRLIPKQDLKNDLIFNS